MAKRNSYRGKRKRSRYKPVEKLAFQFGLVQRGLKNPDSRVSASYERGLKSAERKKKPLF